MNWEYSPARNGNVVQLARLPLNGRRRDRLTLALGFGADRGAALGAARGSLQRGFGDAWAAYAQSWHRWIGSLKQRPASAAAHGPTYWVSLMVLAAAEDKTYTGAGIASPSMPWAWGELTVDEPLGRLPPGLVARPLPGRHRADRRRGPRRRAARARLPVRAPAEGRRLVPAEQPRGRHAASGPTCRWTRWRCRSCSPGSCATSAARPTTSTSSRPRTSWPPTARSAPQERWENQDGYSPGTIAAEIAGLVAAADIARRNGDDASARSWLATADDWQRQARGLDGDRHRPLQPRALLPAADQGQGQPRPERGRDLRDRRQRPARSTSARSWTRASSSSCASA